MVYDRPYDLQILHVLWSEYRDQKSNGWYHEKTRKSTFPEIEWFPYSNARFSDGHCTGQLFMNEKLGKS
jgi:hypothetical protein